MEQTESLLAFAQIALGLADPKFGTPHPRVPEDLARYEERVQRELSPARGRRVGHGRAIGGDPRECEEQ